MAVSLALFWGAQRLKESSGPGHRVEKATPTYGIRFTNVASSVGLRFRWNETVRRPLNIMDGFGCGCAFFDFDEDGFQDVLLVDEPVCGLFRNDEGRAFIEVTAECGLDRVSGNWKGCAVGDFDGDGWRDLCLTGYHRLALLRNLGGRRFQDVTAAAGLDPGNWKDWGASAGFMDLDRDGDLDLVMQNYVEWGPGMPQLCNFRGFRTACPPEVHDPEHPRLFRNLGGGRFTVVPPGGGLSRTTGFGMVLAFSDANEDGKVDFYLGNDGRDANFMENRGALRFRDVALENGTAASGDNELAAMGADWADFNRDGKLDLAVSGFSEEAFALFRNEGRGLFQDVSMRTGLAGATYLPLEFGAKFADVDNDGWPDLFVVAGHIFDDAARMISGATFRQPSMLFRNEQGRQFTNLTPALGGALADPIVGRGSATGDWDNDGRIDLLAVDYEGEPLLLHNQSDHRNHWISLDLRSARGNRHAYGARVRLRAGEQEWVGEVSPASSYLSSSDPRLHFGLGSVKTLASLSITWPTGKREELGNVEVDRILEITEGRGHRTWRPRAQ